jgi:hypothetical protein
MKQSSRLTVVAVVLLLATTVVFLLRMTEDNNPTNVAKQLSNRCAFELPSNVYELHATSWKTRAFPNASEWTLVSIETDRAGVEKLYSSFRKPPLLIKSGRVVRDEEFCKRASWWTLHEYPSGEGFETDILGLQPGKLYINVVQGQTNWIIFMTAILR